MAPLLFDRPGGCGDIARCLCITHGRPLQTSLHSCHTGLARSRRASCGGMLGQCAWAGVGGLYALKSPFGKGGIFSMTVAVRSSIGLAQALSRWFWLFFNVGLLNPTVSQMFRVSYRPWTPGGVTPQALAACVLASAVGGFVPHTFSFFNFHRDFMVEDVG